MASGRAMAGTALAYAIADGFIRGIAFVLLPLLVLHLNRADFGTVGGLGAVAALLTQTLSFGLAAAPIRFYHTLPNTEARRAFLGTIFLGSSLASAVVIALLHLVSPIAVSGLSLENGLLPLIRLTLWTSWFQVLARTIPLGLFRARGDWRSYLVVSVVSFVGTVGAVYWRLAILHQGLPGAVQGMMEGAALTALSAILLASRELSFTVTSDHIRAGVRYGAPLIPHNIAQWTLGLSDRLLVGRMLGVEALGIYHFAYQFAAGLQLLITAANSAIMPSFARVSEASPPGVVGVLGMVSLRFFGAAVVLGLSISVVVPPMITFVFPVGYSPAASYIPWLMVGIVAFGFYCIPANLLTMSLGHTRGIGWFTGLAAILNVGLNLVLIPMWGLVAPVVATIVAYVVMAAGVSWYADRTTVLLSQVVRGRGMLIQCGIGAIGFLLLIVVQQQSAWKSLLFGMVVLGVAVFTTALALRGAASECKAR
jgi:O-antigen/teichoic acid export membrane protein